MEFALWNRAAVMQLLERECAIKLSMTAIVTNQGQVESVCNINPSASSQPLQLLQKLQRPRNLNRHIVIRNATLADRNRAAMADGDQGAGLRAGIVLVHFVQQNGVGKAVERRGAHAVIGLFD